MTRNALNVLLIKDNPGDADLIREYLSEDEDVAFDLVWSDRLSAGLERLAEERFDLVLLDLSLPDSEGLETFDKARRQAPHIPIIILTGREDKRLALRAVKQGAQDYVAKASLNGATLARIIQHAVERHRMMAEMALRAEALRASEERLRTIIGKSADGMVVVDANGVIRFVNPSAEALFGRKADGLLGEMFGFPVVGGDTTEVEVFRAGGGIAIAEMRVVETEWEGERAFLASLRDITERKRAEAALRQAQKMEALGQLAGGIAHDFNNLLVPIMGLTEMTMAEVPAESQWRSDLQEVLDASERAGELVEQILAFSRAEEPERHPIELHRIVSEASKLLRATLPTTIELRQHIDKHSGAVLANTTEIHQVMMNLGSNAADAMGANGGVLEVTLGVVEVTDEIAAGHAALEPGRYLKLTVNDTGCGMDEETMGRIFDPFYTTKEVGKGTGMGLAFIHGIVTSHGGAITVSSEPGRGTRFDIYFPLWEGKAEAALSAGGPIPEALENQPPVPVLQQQQG